MEWLWFMAGLLLGGLAAGLAVWQVRRTAASSPAPDRWPTVLVPLLIGESSHADLPKAALCTALSLAPGGKVVFDLFIEVPRSHGLEAQMVAETEVSLELIEAAEEEARRHGRIIESNIQKVRDYGYGVVEAARQLGAKAVVLQVASVLRSPAQRGELGSSVRQPNISALTTLIHDRAGCDVLITPSEI